MSSKSMLMITISMRTSGNSTTSRAASRTARNYFDASRHKQDAKLKVRITTSKAISNIKAKRSQETTEKQCTVGRSKTKVDTYSCSRKSVSIRNWQAKSDGYRQQQDKIEKHHARSSTHCCRPKAKIEATKSAKRSNGKEKGSSA